MVNYPSRSDIVTAVRNPDVCFKAKELFGGSVIQNGSRIIQYSGGYSTVFPFNTASLKKIALRCWIADIGDAKKRSQDISAYLSNLKCPYFIDFKYIDEGLLINGQIYPIVIMDWVEAQPLKEYLSSNYHNLQAVANKLAEDFLTMVKYFHQIEIAHGDLQHGNILIKEDGSIVVIDYDSMYIEPLIGMPDTIKGLPGYQHPSRKNNLSINPKMDFFSELIIYLSLKVFAKYPNLWTEYVDTEDLLFSVNDFVKPDDSFLFNKLMNSNDELISRLTKKVMDLLVIKEIEHLPCLEEVIISPLEKTKHDIFGKWENQPNPPTKKKVVLPDSKKITDKF